MRLICNKIAFGVVCLVMGLLGSNTVTAITVSHTEFPSCAGSNNGKIDVTVNGGAANYSYEWDNSVTTGSMTGISSNKFPINNLSSFEKIKMKGLTDRFHKVH